MISLGNSLTEGTPRTQLRMRLLKVRRRSPGNFAPSLSSGGWRFFVIAVVAMWLNPEGFSAEAIVLWPVTGAILMLTSFTALIAYLVRR
jgi:hypothetical protein